MIEVEVVDVPLDYNILLGRNWMYSMQAVASSLFRVIFFPFNGKVVTIDQTSFQNPCVNASSGASISIVDHCQPKTGVWAWVCILLLWEPLVVMFPCL